MEWSSEYHIRFYNDKARRIASGVLGLSAVLLLAAMSGIPRLNQGDRAPDFSLEDLAGHSIRLVDYHGKPVLLHFWATWCKPCVKELPEIEAGYRALHDQGFTVLAINVGDDKADVREFTNRLGLTFPVLLDPGWHTAERYNVTGLPVSIFVSRQGTVQDKVTGGTLTEEKIRQRFGNDTAIEHDGV